MLITFVEIYPIKRRELKTITYCYYRLSQTYFIILSTYKIRIQTIPYCMNIFYILRNKYENHLMKI